MKKFVDLVLVAAMLATAVPGIADSGATPPEPPQMGEGQPPELPDGEFPGEPPEGFSDMRGEGPGGQPGEAPDGMPGGAPGGMPGGSTQPDSYNALNSYDADAALDGEAITSTGTDENAILVTGGAVTVTDSAITRDSDDSTGGDNASFYGVGAALLVTGGVLSVDGCAIETDASGGTGVFAYGDGTAYVSDTIITTKQNTSGGIHVAGGGKLKAVSLTVETFGGSAAAIRSDRGSGTMTVEGGTYTSHGSGSPAVYVTADISIKDAELTATGSEALCLEGLNAVRLYNCDLSGNMPDDAQNDNTWTVILYQSMSGDAQVGEGSFTMDGGSLISGNGGIFYTTNTDSVFVIRDVEILAENSDYFLRVTGNSNQRGWGSSGSNGANCVFTAIQQTMNGDVIYDSISNLTLYLTEGTVFTGAVLDDESCAGNGGSGAATLVIDENSQWVVTADSVLTNLYCAGSIVDAEGRTVTIAGTDGTVYAQGESDITVTVSSYADGADTSGAGVIRDWSEYDVL